MRDYDRGLRGAHPDPDRVSAIWAEADAIEQVQRGRRAHRGSNVRSNSWNHGRMGKNRRYGTDVSRAAINEFLTRPAPVTLTPEEIGAGPVVTRPPVTLERTHGNGLKSHRYRQRDRSAD
ncbi:hypothetical protein [Curtobacterium sp. MCBD17_028]|uniref:hypothetical protein n=1 Tax=Curtobacterium sp. MCBD17_028 TaxID=2175670 RepID=UPI0011B491E6|nr:hypothetical protein [Curtobacterium sp. MCBD17_028]